MGILRSYIRSSFLIFLLAGLIVFLSCAAHGQGERVAIPNMAGGEHKGVGTTLGVGDVFEIRVFMEPELSAVYRVSSDGVINFPLIGKITASGLSAIQLADIIAQKLKDGYLADPQVSIFIKEYNSKKVFIFGEVQRPGTFLYDEDMTIIQAITIAGGFTRNAEKNKVSVTRLDDGIEKRIFLSVENIGRGKEKNFFLKPGDIIFVPESFF